MLKDTEFIKGDKNMAKCTAPVYGHRTASGRAACPVCGNSGYSSRNYSYSGSYHSPSSYLSSSIGSKVSSSKPSWSPSNSTIVYSNAEVRGLTPIRRSVEKRQHEDDCRDVFLCHAWDDRNTVAKELHDALESVGVSVWFSEKDVDLGSSLLREIDKGLAKSKVGIVLVTPALLSRLRNEGIADKELSALLARELLVPIIHKTSYDALREVSPLLASRTGLNIDEDSMGIVASKLFELVTP